MVTINAALLVVVGVAVAGAAEAAKVKTTLSFLKERLDGDVYFWDETVDASDHARPLAVGHLELFGGASREDADRGAGASALAAFVEQGAVLHAHSRVGGDENADPQNLSPDSLQCYCKFKRPKIQTVPASAFNNAGQTLPTDDDAGETSFLEAGEKTKLVARSALRTDVRSASDEDATRPLLRRGGAGAAATEPDATLLEVEEHDARAREPSHGIDRKSDRGGDGALAANSSAAGPHAAAYARGFEAGLRKAAQQRDWAAMERDSDSQRGW
jgi:hypothetical protein